MDTAGGHTTRTRSGRHVARAQTPIGSASCSKHIHTQVHHTVIGPPPLEGSAGSKRGISTPGHGWGMPPRVVEKKESPSLASERQRRSSMAPSPGGRWGMGPAPPPTAPAPRRTRRRTTVSLLEGRFNLQDRMHMHACKNHAFTNRVHGCPPARGRRRPRKVGAGREEPHPGTNTSYASSVLVVVVLVVLVLFTHSSRLRTQAPGPRWARSYAWRRIIYVIWRGVYVCMSMSLSIYVSVHHLCKHIPLYLYLAICLSIYLSIYIYISIYISNLSLYIM